MRWLLALAFGLALWWSPARADSIYAAPIDSTAWTVYTPTPSCNSGTITTDTIAGRYKFLTPKTVIVQITIAVTVVGTCTGNVNFTLPAGTSVNTTIGFYVGSGYDNGTGLAAGPVIGVNSSAILAFATAIAAHPYFLTLIYETP